MLTAGTRLGPDEIQRRVGAGGMGEVYRTRESLASDPMFRERFEREARAMPVP